MTKLLYSYRSLPSILKLYSNLFYNGDLYSTLSETASPESKMLESISNILPNVEKRCPKFGVCFIGVRGQNQQCNDSPSWYNSAEAKSVIESVLRNKK